MIETLQWGHRFADPLLSSYRVGESPDGKNSIPVRFLYITHQSCDKLGSDKTQEAVIVLFKPEN
jgi:hypothetical protein